MNVLVAGGAGFIGSHLIDGLLSEGHRVCCIDNYCIGTKENITHLNSNKNFFFYEENLCNLSKMKSIFEKESFDFIYHMAANSDIQASAKNPEIEFSNTYTSTFNILECMRICEVKNFFFCSTSAVYGDALGKDVDENYAPLMPISYYGASKLGCECLISAFSYMNDINALIFRFPNVIGNRLTHGVIFDFVKRLKDDQTQLTILGDGMQSKPYLHVDDLVSCILEYKNFITKGVSLYNVGVNSQTTVTRIAEIVVEEMALKNVEFHYTGGKGGWKGDVPIFSYNLDKIHKTGWKASMTSDEAVRKTVKQVVR